MAEKRNHLVDWFCGLKKNSWPKLGPLELLVLQPTPFCNLDCDYCYLPNRSSNSKMTNQVLDKVFLRIFESRLISDEFTIVWHAGEPLVMGLEFYQNALYMLANRKTRAITINQSIQTNGVLINDDWCRFFRDNDIRVGVSVDGPAPIHDRHRKTRLGGATHKKVQQGMQCLNENGIDYHVISVLTRDSLDHPREIFDYFVDNDIHSCCFNVEETEGVNKTSSLCHEGIEKKVKWFMAQFYDYRLQSGYPIYVRELDGAHNAILGWRKSDMGHLGNTQELAPYKIISVDVNGYFSSYSPELLGINVNEFGRFTFGNVISDSFEEVARTPKFQKVYHSIQSGINRCKKTCGYYELCGGGSPSNKFFENGTFDSDETLFCRLHHKAAIDVVLDKHEASLGIASNGTNP